MARRHEIKGRMNVVKRKSWKREEGSGQLGEKERTGGEVVKKAEKT